MNAVVAFSQLMVFDFIGMELKPVYWIRNSHCVDKLVAYKNVSFVTWNAQLKKKRRRVYENTSNIYSYLDILVETMVRYLVVTGAFLGVCTCYCEELVLTQLKNCWIKN